LGFTQCREGSARPDERSEEALAFEREQRIDIFRPADDGRVVERWHMLPPIPVDSANEDTMF
jgi:hypothetical protein